MATKKSDKIIALSSRQMLIKRINIWFGRELGDSERPFSSQKTVALREIVDNSIDAIRKSSKKGNIRLTINEDYSFECYDSGGGIPVDISKTADGKPASSLYLALGVMNAGSNYEDTNTSSLGTNGVGGSCTQMLSLYTNVEVYRNKKMYTLNFKDGVPVTYDANGKAKELKDLTYLAEKKDSRTASEKKEFPSGTKITLKLNDELFKSKYPYDIDDLIERLKGVAFLIPEIKITIINKLRKMEDGSPQIEEFQFEGGIKQLLELNTSDRITDIFSLEKIGKLREESIDVTNGKAEVKNIEKDIKVEAAFAYSNNYDYFVDSYVNTIKTRLNGFHVDAFEKAFITTMTAKFRSLRGGLNAKDEDPTFDDFKEGLNAVVSVSIPEPEFTNQIKEELGGKKAYKEFLKLYTEALEEWIKQAKNQDAIKIMADKVITASRNRVKAKEQQEIKRQKAKLERSTSMPVKLVDCEITHDPKSELFIVEGDSALGGLKAARDSKYQALFPLRGKVRNVLKSTDKAILQTVEVQDIIKCMDAGVGKDFDIDKARYSKIIIASDADP